MLLDCCVTPSAISKILRSPKPWETKNKWFEKPCEARQILHLLNLKHLMKAHGCKFSPENFYMYIHHEIISYFNFTLNNLRVLLVRVGLSTMGSDNSFAWIGQISLDYRVCFFTNGVFDSKANTSRRIPPSGLQTICWHYKAPCLLLLTRGLLHCWN